jgi:RNA-directed DNA polymerase
MKESHRKDLASHPDPESCVGGREAAGEAFDRGTRRPAIELRNLPSGVPTPLSEAEGHTEGGAIGKPPEDPAQSETLCMRGNSSHRKREIPQVPTGLVPRGRSGKAIGRTPDMHAWGKSDDCVVPGKPPNKGEHLSPAEVVEGRRSTKGSPMSGAVSRTQSRINTSLLRHRARGAALPSHRHHPR